MREKYVETLYTNRGKRKRKNVQKPDHAKRLKTYILRSGKKGLQKKKKWIPLWILYTTAIHNLYDIETLSCVCVHYIGLHSINRNVLCADILVHFVCDVEKPMRTHLIAHEIKSDRLISMSESTLKWKEKKKTSE